MKKFIEFARSLVALAKEDARLALLIVENQIEHQQESLQFALSHVQQSVEKASKALLLLTENPKYDMPYLRQKLSHDSLHAMLEFIRITVEIEDLKPMVRQSVKDDVYGRLRKVIRESRTYEHGLARLSPHEVDGYLRVPGQIASDKLLADIIPDQPLTLTLDQVDEDDMAGSVMDMIGGYLNFPTNEQQKETVRPLAQKIIDIRGGEDNLLAELRSVGSVEIDVRYFIGKQFMFTRLVVGLYVMSALTFPHAVSARYPTEAGNDLRYDQSLGVIALIGKLAEEADRIATDFLENFDQIHEGVRRLHVAYEQEEDSSSP